MAASAKKPMKQRSNTNAPDNDDRRLETPIGSPMVMLKPLAILAAALRERALRFVVGNCGRVPLIGSSCGAGPTVWAAVGAPW